MKWRFILPFALVLTAVAAYAQQVVLPPATMPGITGDVVVPPGSNTSTLANVYSGPASCTAPQILVPTAVDTKGRITAAACITPAAGGSVSVTAATGSCITINPSPGTGTFTVGENNNVADQATAPFTIGPSNICGILRMNGGTTAAVANLSQAGTSSGQIPPGSALMAINIGSAQVTVTPATSKINGFSTVILAPGGWVYLVADSSGNYVGLIGGPSGSGFGQ